MRFPSRPTPARLGWPDSPPPGSRPGLGHPCCFAVGKEGGSGVRGGWGESGLCGFDGLDEVGQAQTRLGGA